MKLLTFCLALLCCGGFAPQNHSVQIQDSQDLRVTLHFDKIPLRAVLKQLFKGIDISYTVAPDLQGVITADFKDVPIETAMRSILKQVNGTYRTSGIYEFLREISHGDPDPNLVFAMPEFRPGSYSNSFEVKNKELYLAPDRTMGGTLNLLEKAGDKAGFSHSYLYRYGEHGFALVMPIETVDKKGQTHTEGNRFSFVTDQAGLDFRHITDIWSAYGEDLTFSFRILVLLVTSDPLKIKGISDGKTWLITSDRWTLPDNVKSRVWKTDPTLWALVYELRTVSGSPKAVLLKKGESGFGAKAHVLDAGLWAPQQLGPK